MAVVIREKEKKKKMETKNVGSSVNNGSRRSSSPLDDGLNGGARSRAPNARGNDKNLSVKLKS